jgi:hypothetical protein
MDYQVYSEEELETLEVIRSYSKTNKAGMSNIIPINHKPSAERLLSEKVKAQEDEADPWYMVEENETDFDGGRFYNEVVPKHRIYMEA